MNHRYIPFGWRTNAINPIPAIFRSIFASASSVETEFWLGEQMHPRVVPHRPHVVLISHVRCEEANTQPTKRDEDYDTNRSHNMTYRQR